MTTKYIFADEAGDFAFSRNAGASKYFIVCTAIFNSCEIAHQMIDLRRELVRGEKSVRDYFHCCEDKQDVRDSVFALLKNAKFDIHATILEKSKAQPQVRVSKERFYKYGWYFHFSGTSIRLAKNATHLCVTAASIGTKKGQAVFSAAVDDVVHQKIKATKYTTHFCPSYSDPCLQVVDYCTWAIQRKWERNDSRSYDLIKHLIDHEHETWKDGATHYY